MSRPRAKPCIAADSRLTTWRDPYLWVGYNRAVKTTVEIPDALLKRAKRYAAEHDITLREVIEQGVRHVIQPQPETQKTVQTP